MPNFQMINSIDQINELISRSKVNKNLISDGYHTFGELYEHRVQLFIKLCEFLSDGTPPYCEGYGCIFPKEYRPWRSKTHNDGTGYEGWFLMGIGKDVGKQITYHLPISKWEECGFAETLKMAPPWDGHTSEDVLVRLQEL